MTTKPLAPATLMISSSYPTAFGLYDSDETFCEDADSFIVYVRRKLGGSTLQVELTSRDIWTVFEEAVMEYSTLVNMYRAMDVALDVLGVPSGSVSDLDGVIPHHTLRLARHYTAPANIEAGMGGQTIYSGSFVASQDTQHHYLENYFSIPAGKRMEVRDIYWESPWQFLRLYNTTTALNYLNREFRFESYTPETLWYLLPIHEDVMRAGMFKLQDSVRRSRYSWTVVNNILTLYPAPRTDKTVWVKYTLEDYNPKSTERISYLYVSGSITHPSQIPFGLIKYGSFSQMARTYIRKLGLALAKGLLGQIRGKLASIPLPDGDMTLNGADLVSQSQTEIEGIRTELKEFFEQWLPANLMVKEKEKQDSISETYKKIAMKVPIFIG